MATKEKLADLIQRYTILESEKGWRQDVEFPTISWQEIWDAAQEEGIITADIVDKSVLISIPASRRGPAVAGDIVVVEKIASMAALKKYRAPRFPHTTLSQDFGYLIKGLPLQQQKAMLEITQVEIIGESLFLDSKGVSLLATTFNGYPNRLWSLPSAQIQTPSSLHLFQTILEMGKVRPTVIDLVTTGLQYKNTFEEGMIHLSNQALNILLREKGYEIQADTSPLDLTSNTHTINATPIEKTVRETIIASLSLEHAPWYPAFQGSLRKLLKNYTDLDSTTALKIWGKIIRNLPRVGEVAQFFPETFTQLSQDHSTEEAFIGALDYITDLGVKMFESTTEGIRTSGGRTADYLPYVHGKDALTKILDLASQSKDTIIGFQQFNERSETGLLVKRLAQTVKERGMPIPGIILDFPEVNSLDISIIAALREI